MQQFGYYLGRKVPGPATPPGGRAQQRRARAVHTVAFSTNGGYALAWRREKCAVATSREGRVAAIPKALIRSTRERGAMSMHPARLVRRPLAAAMLLALAVPGAAMAQSDREKELEARVAELERQVQALVTATTQQQATQPAAPAVPAGKQPIQATTITPSANPGTTFSYTGFIKMDAMVTETSDGRIADGSSGRLFYVPSTIPVGGPGADGGDPYTDFHAQFSRFGLGVDHVTADGNKLKGYVEADFFGGGSNALAGNETATNTYAVTLRHAYVSWNNWPAGQTWSNCMDVAALPDAVDFVGPTGGTVFVRQAQVRYTNGPWSVSVENPQTTVTPYLSSGARFNSGDNIAP